MQIIDLSYEIIDHMPVYPGDKDTEIRQIKKYSDDGYNAFYFSSSMHAGTHIDMPRHMLDDERYTSAFPVSDFISDGIIIDSMNETKIDYKPEYENLDLENTAVLIKTGFCDMYKDTAEYYADHPILTKRFAEYLAERKIQILGIDFPSPDRMPYEIHKILLSADIKIVENLTNLAVLKNTKKFRFYAVPLKINAEASLVRAFAEIL